MKIRPFQERLLPAPVGGGFQQEDYWVWCGSVAQGEDGRFHMFAARWPKRFPFFHGYLAASEIVRASSDTPEGPYQFEEVILTERDWNCWDGRITSNPFIVRHKDEWLLFYIGSTYHRETPTREEMDALRLESPGNGRFFPWYDSIRIGMARSKSIFGPWERPDAPTFDIDPTSWDNTVTTNPTPCVLPDGRIFLYYRSAGCRLGLAEAKSPDHPFVRVRKTPVVDPGEGLEIEDPFVWWDTDHFEMVAKDITGGIGGVREGGVHLLSPDGVDWNLAPEPKAWSKTFLWNDGRTVTQGSFERPFILFQNNSPTFLFAATGDGPGPHDGRQGYCYAGKTWNMVLPLKQ